MRARFVTKVVFGFLAVLLMAPAYGQSRKRIPGAPCTEFENSSLTRAAVATSQFTASALDLGFVIPAVLDVKSIDIVA
jgi:hypothetical protein